MRDGLSHLGHVPPVRRDRGLRQGGVHRLQGLHRRLPLRRLFINPEDHSAEKCNFCAHRLDMGLEPACVVVCPTEAILVGDLGDPLAKVTRMVHEDALTVRRPEKETRPKLFYKDARQVTLDRWRRHGPRGGSSCGASREAGPTR